jgi:hypothetical protein
MLECVCSHIVLSFVLALINLKNLSMELINPIKRSGKEDMFNNRNTKKQTLSLLTLPLQLKQKKKIKNMRVMQIETKSDKRNREEYKR